MKIAGDSLKIQNCLSTKDKILHELKSNITYNFICANCNAS